MIYQTDLINIMNNMRLDVSVNVFNQLRSHLVILK